MDWIIFITPWLILIFLTTFFDRPRILGTIIKRTNNLILLGLNSTILADYLGVHIPLVRQVFGFIALTFLPGYLILRIFNTKLESLSEEVAFEVALSISVVMLIGIFANFISPYFGVKNR